MIIALAVATVLLAFIAGLCAGAHMMAAQVRAGRVFLDGHMYRCMMTVLPEKHKSIFKR